MQGQGDLSGEEKVPCTLVLNASMSQTGKENGWKRSDGKREEMFKDPAPAGSGGVWLLELWAGISPRKQSGQQLGTILALRLPCVIVFAFFHVFNFVFNSVIKGLALYNTVISLHALRFSVWWEKGKQMKLKIRSLIFLQKEWINAEGNMQAAPRVCSLGWIWESEFGHCVLPSYKGQIF